MVVLFCLFVVVVFVVVFYYYFFGGCLFVVVVVVAFLASNLMSKICLCKQLQKCFTLFFWFFSICCCFDIVVVVAAAAVVFVSDSPKPSGFLFEFQSYLHDLKWQKAYQHGCAQGNLNSKKGRGPKTKNKKRQKKEEQVLILNKSTDRIFSTFLGRLASWRFGPLEIFHD